MIIEINDVKLDIDDERIEEIRKGVYLDDPIGEFKEGAYCFRCKSTDNATCKCDYPCTSDMLILKELLLAYQTYMIRKEYNKTNPKPNNDKCDDIIKLFVAWNRVKEIFKRFTVGKRFRFGDEVTRPREISKERFDEFWTLIRDDEKDSVFKKDLEHPDSYEKAYNAWLNLQK